jgi:hypothetical protein
MNRKKCRRKLSWLSEDTRIKLQIKTIMLLTGIQASNEHADKMEENCIWYVGSEVLLVLTENHSFLGCNPVYLGDSPTFERNILLPSSVLKSKPSKTPALQAELAACFCCFIAWLALQPWRRGHYIPPKFQALTELQCYNPEYRTHYTLVLNYDAQAEQNFGKHEMVWANETCDNGTGTLKLIMMVIETSA